MKTVKLIFLILSILLPLIFIVLAMINIKSVKKSRKSRFRIAVAIIALFTVNFTIYRLITVKKLELKPSSKEVQDVESTESNEEDKEVEELNKPMLNGTTNTGMKMHTKDGITRVEDLIIVNKNYTLPEDYIPSNTFKSVTKDTKICAQCLVKEVYDAYLKMEEAAKKDKIKLWIQSGYRSYSYQKVLFENYVKKDGEEKASRYSAKAGQSEHQTGLAFDVNIVDDSFAKTKEGKWINANAYKYGFIIRYPLGKEEETGYKYEPWHLRYVGKDLAKTLYNNGDWISLESYLGLI